MQEGGGRKEEKKSRKRKIEKDRVTQGERKIRKYEEYVISWKISTE